MNIEKKAMRNSQTHWVGLKIIRLFPSHVCQSINQTEHKHMRPLTFAQNSKKPIFWEDLFVKDFNVFIVPQAHCDAGNVVYSGASCVLAHAALPELIP